MPTSDAQRSEVTTLRRYTDLPALLYLLRRKKLTLLNPSSWDDRNDTRFLELYCETRRLGAVLALCFTEVGETYHHWRVFSPGSCGVCIRFQRQRLVDLFAARKGFRFGPVQYKTMQQVRTTALAPEELPFVKRHAFRDEREFRLVFESLRPIATRDFPLPLDCIDRITINPWVNAKLSEAMRETILGIEGCAKLVVGQSSLVNNNEWQKLAAAATLRR